ncbi:TPA: hypothetical protein ACIJOI_004482, partial [Raoultella ornithinolytica]
VLFCVWYVLLFNKSGEYVIGVLLCVKIVFLINNTMEVLMLLVVLNSFLTNVISLVTKNSAILWA